MHGVRLRPVCGQDMSTISTYSRTGYSLESQTVFCAYWGGYLADARTHFAPSGDERSRRQQLVASWLSVASSASVVPPAARSHGQHCETAHPPSAAGALRACRLPIQQRAMTETGLQAVKPQMGGEDSIAGAPQHSSNAARRHGWLGVRQGTFRSAARARPRGSFATSHPATEALA